MKMIDPPSGWKYGFPKAIPDNVENVKEWLVINGYPQKEIDDCGKYFYCRYWKEPVWNCPINDPECKENCGNYGCGN
jgi:hypothetical protein